MTRLLRDMRLLGAVAAGLIGYALFIGVTPLLHPDAAIDPISREEAIETAIRFAPALADPGEVDVIEAAVRRNETLLRNLQKEYGLRTLRAMLHRGELDPLPVYEYRIQWFVRDDGQEDRRRVAEVTLLPGGGVVHADVSELPDRPGDADALRAAGYDGPLPAPRPLLFHPPPGLPPVDPDDERPRVDAEALARHHLGRTAFADLEMRVDSIIVVQHDTQSAARVLFSSNSFLGERRVRLEARVGSDGSLTRLNLREVKRDDAAASSDVTINAAGRRDVSGVLIVAVHVALFLLILGLFFRRTSSRMIDFKYALRDALWASTWLMLSVGATVGYQMVTSMGFQPMSFLLASLLIVSAGALGTFLIFVVSAVGDSYQRAVAPESLRSLDLVRRFRFLNPAVGRSLVAGTAVAGVLLGLQTLGLLTPGAAIQLGEDLTGTFAVRTSLSEIGSAMWVASYVAFALIAVPGGLRMRFGGGVAAAASIVLLAVTDIARVSFEPIWLALLVSGGLGVAIVAASRQFDLVAVAVTLLLGSTIWATFTAWLTPQPSYTIDLIVVGAVAAGTFLVGLLGIVRGDDDEARATFVPDYVREIGRQQRIERELEIARGVQESLLPRHLPAVPGLDLAAMCVPAAEVGGDYFDVIQIDAERVGVIIGDVSGKGIQAAFYMTLVKGIVQTLAATEADPVTVLSRLNAHFYANAPRGTFISVVYGVIDLRERTFRFARAGHNPVLVRRSSDARFSRPGGMAIGLVNGPRFASTLESHNLDLGPGDSILLYTDGITEAMDGRRSLFGEKRLAETVRTASAHSAAELLNAVRDAVTDFTRGAEQSDDMTAVLIRIADPADRDDGGTESLLESSPSAK